MKRLRLLSILFFTLLASPAFSQLPNGSFETWKAVLGVDLPQGWFTSSATVPGSDVYPVTKTDDKQDGSYAIRLQTIKTNSMGEQRITQGMAITGKIDLSKGVQLGFPLTYRPEKLAFYYKYQPVFGDSMSIFMTVKVAGEPDPIGYAAIASSQQVDQFTFTELTIDYTSQETPDSAIIYMFSGQDTMHEGSLLIVDNMKLEGGNPGFEENGKDIFASPYPNPSTGLTYFPLLMKSSGKVVLEISDVNGKIISSQNEAISGAGAMKFDVSSLSPGVYVYKISTGNSVRVGKLIRTR